MSEVLAKLEKKGGGGSDIPAEIFSLAGVSSSIYGSVFRPNSTCRAISSTPDTTFTTDYLSYYWAWSSKAITIKARKSCRVVYETTSATVQEKNVSANETIITTTSAINALSIIVYDK